MPEVIKTDKPSNKQFLRFLEEVAKLNEYEYFGLLHILGVRAVDASENNRPVEETLEEAMDKFLKLNRIRRRNLMKILKKSSNRKIDFERTRAAAQKLKEMTENGTQNSKN